MPHSCFWLEPTNRVQLYLVRSTWDQADKVCPQNAFGDRHHLLRALTEEFEYPLGAEFEASGRTFPEAEGPRWPAACSCGYVFEPDDDRSTSTNRIYVRTDTGVETTINDAGVGAMWDSYWYVWTTPGPDGIRLSVQTPGGAWHVDGQASNCGMPDDRRQERHHCWTRHGDVQARPPTVTVDKTSGPTCNAGGGSIQCGNYHGFLQNGALVP